jgi:Cu/Ag efflux pump CusA
MLNAIVGFSLRFRGIVIALAIAFLAYGVYTLTEAKYDVFPEFAPPLVVIQAEAAGLSPEQVELLVTMPIETSINGVPGIASLRSSSIQGVSLITVTFQPSTDIYRARQLVAERLSVATTRLPQGVSAPRMTPLTSSTSTVLGIGLTSQSVSLMDLRTIADWTIRLRLLAVPGVASVTRFGGDIQQYQIQLIPDKLIQHDVSVDEVLAAARQATGVMGAGFIDTANQRFVMQTQGQSLTVDQLAMTVVFHRNGANLTLGDVAQIQKAPEPPFGAGGVMGKPGVILMVDAQYEANIMQVTKCCRESRERPPAGSSATRSYG